MAQSEGNCAEPQDKKNEETDHPQSVMRSNTSWYTTDHPGVIEFTSVHAPWEIDSAHITQIYASPPNCVIGKPSPTGPYPESILFPNATPFTFHPHVAHTGQGSKNLFIGLSQGDEFVLVGFRVDQDYLRPVTLYGYWMDFRPLLEKSRDAKDLVPFNDFNKAFDELNKGSKSGADFINEFLAIQKKMTGGTGTYGAGNQGT
ncbi:hypothetical protein SCOR_28025 [Sulfidibacter corallicola]|uniref:Uncharacterized protein n=1 Tax=Sulfidibacter corallicola TaxID=2818388 RepID=A0A8A4TN08_SULCO|nr:hypothetical protein [Sulfidibacter corallicola]QTD50594.1 hypothetical protein J3U87_33840 [Sulfidibacter corallicola]